VMTWAMIGRIISVIILSVLPRTMKCEAYRFHLLMSAAHWDPLLSH
jgi:hypothetical protein